MTQVKICGITNLDDALLAAEAGADMLGFIFAEVSKRYITHETAHPIIEQVKELNHAPLCIGVFVVADGMSPADVLAQCQISGIDAAQIVDMSAPEFLTQLDFPAYGCIRPATPEQAMQETAQFEHLDQSPNLPTLLLDAFHPKLYGGTGHTAPKAIARAVSQQSSRLMLAGGLNPDNVAEYIRDVQPWAVDVASGTEATPGKKDPAKVREFIQAAKS